MKVLVVDDDIVSRKKIERIITNLNLTPIVANDGKMGFDMWRNERPRIVITDWIMPEMDGPELCALIRKSEGSQYTYILIVTSKTDKSELIKGIEAGADDFVTKPYAIEELSVRIRSGQRILDFGSRDIAIFAISKLAESRDPETGNHLERIRHYSKMLAETLLEKKYAPNELDMFFISNLYLTSPLHDIGKIGIPDHVLLKPGRLDDKEFGLMKFHTVIGFDTLNEAAKKDLKADYLRMSADIALGHHEKFNGEGYPKGLSGTDIPLSARIVAIADVYDALVSKRVYKNAMPHDVARSIIVQDKGKHFDPDMVDAFIKCEQSFIDIHSRFDADSK